MTILPQSYADKLRRAELYAFTIRVFEILNPGSPYVPNWHVEAMSHSFMRVASGDCRRLLVTVPPRHLKSITASVALPAWILGRDPSFKIMVASYGDDLASKHGQDCRTVMNSAWYKRLFPRTALARQIVTDLQTSQSGGRKAVSLGGAATGLGADLIIIDDLMKAADANSPSERQRVKDYFDQTLYSRQNDKQAGVFLAIQQRLHEDDLAAYLIDKASFEHLNLPAIAEETEHIELRPGPNGRRFHRRNKGEALFAARESLQNLEQIRREIGATTFSAQYQQNPIAPQGNRFQWKWVSTYLPDAANGRAGLLGIVQSWDVATSIEPSADYSVCTIWGLRKDSAWLLLDLKRQRLDYPSLKERVCDLQKRWRAEKVLIECAGTGQALLQDLSRDRRNRWLNVPRGTFYGITPSGDKETRLDAQTAKVEAGEVLFPETAQWLPALKQELLAFPMGRHDDQVDSISQFLCWLGTRRGENLVLRGLNGGELPRPQSPRDRRPARPRPIRNC